MSLLASLRARLSDSEPETRRLATKDLPRLPVPESCELLLLALGDADWRVRKEAATAAVRIEPRTAVVFAVARALGDSENIGARNAAVEALVLIGPDAVPGAVDALGRLDADGRKLALEVLAGAPTLGGMRAMVRALSDSDPNVVLAAADGLAQAHLAGEEAREAAVFALKRVVQSGLIQARLAALTALASLGAKLEWSDLEPLMSDPILRRQAIAAATGTQAPRALLALAEACADPNETFAREAVIALGESVERAWGNDELLDIPAKMLRASTFGHERLIEFAKRGDGVPVRTSAILLLGLIRDPDDVAILCDALSDTALAEHAEAALVQFGEPAVKPLLAAGRTAAPSIRGAAISILPQVAPNEPMPIVAVREALADSSPDVVVPALKTLALVGDETDLVRTAKHITSKDARVATAAQVAALSIANRNPAAARAEIARADARGERAMFATTLVEALGRARQHRPSDVEFLSEALSHREARVRRAAIDAFASVGGDDAVSFVSLALTDEEPIVSSAAIRALGRLGRADELAALAATAKEPAFLGDVLRSLRDADPERAFAAARPLLRSSDSQVASAAVEVVGAVAISARVEALMSVVDHPDREIVKLALARLAETGDERALASLTSALDHDDVGVRRHAAELLGREQSPEVEGILRSRLERERDADARRAIMDALAARAITTGST